MIRYIGMAPPMPSTDAEHRHRRRPAPLPAHWSDHPCLDLVNSRWQDHLGSGESFDRLQRPEWREALLARWGLRLAEPVGPHVLSELATLRALLRRLLEGFGRGEELPASDLEELNRAMAASASTRCLARGVRSYRLEVSYRHRDWRWAMAEMAASAAALIARGEPSRLKVCGNDACSWLFYDESRNRSRRWCESSLCGNLVKVRRFRARAAGRPAERPAALPGE